MIAAVDHCLRLIELLAQQPGGCALGDLASSLDLPKSAVHRLLAALSARGYVLQDPATQDYQLSLRLAVLGFRHLDAASLPDAAQGVLDELARASGEYCRLAVVEGESLIWVARAQGAPPGLRYEPDMSQAVILHATATGKAWLATLPESEALRIVAARGFQARASAGKNVARGEGSLRKHLLETRQRGHALAIDEGEQGTVALAAPFRAWDDPDAPVAGTVSIAGPLVRMDRATCERLAEPLLLAARQLATLWPLRRRQAFAEAGAAALATRRTAPLHAPPSSRTRKAA